MDLKDQTAVVTGASRGIGRAIAVRLAQAGANVIVWANRSADDAQRAAAEIRAHGVNSEVVLADLADPVETVSIINHIWSESDVDIWVNNAGADVLTGECRAMSFAEKLERLWAVDVMGTIHCSREVGARMQAAGRGAIINMGWDQAWQGMEGESGEMFATVKGAIMAFTKSLAKSLAPEVRVNCVAPGWIKTAWGEEASDYWQARAQHESLLGRWGTPEDIAAAVGFLASPAASFVNGQILPVNGGFRSSLEDRSDVAKRE